MLVGMSFVSLITEPTRCTDTSSTLNKERKFKFFVSKLGVPDHFLTCASLKSTKNNKFTIKKLRDHSALSLSGLGTIFHHQTSFDNLMISTSTLDD